ncbi:MAG: M23 family metallopeptidase [Proteobacteria bacterium]|nr:M23 family metallopeptidase [Pseudomonadota bacterium]
MSFLTWQPGPAAASDFQLSLPLACKIGAVCSIQNYVDRDPGPEARDYTCGRLVYDGHKGTDFRLPDMGWLTRDIAVLAAAPGEVIGTRNDAPDHAPTAYQSDRDKGRECGNGVLIDHGGGWRTQYCHMRQGSVRVRKGDRVSRQQPLGIIGLSGKTEFPHLHLGVTHGDSVVDPFLGAEAKPGCGVTGRPLWAPDLLADLAYRPSGILAAGFTDRVPTRNQVVAGQHRHDQLDRKAPNLVFWVMIFGRLPGDEEILQVTAPDGTVLVRKQGPPAKAHKVRWFTYGGKRARGPWAPGIYQGEYQLFRITAGRRQVALTSTAKVRVE